jgi:hypothetical protein
MICISIPIPDIYRHCFTSLLFIDKCTPVKGEEMVVSLGVGYNYYGACGGIVGGILIIIFM